jgi:hypothetical protein
MCTRPDHRSLPSTMVGLREAIVAVLVSVAVLILALATAPARWLQRRRTARMMPAPVSHVDIQIHLADAKCVAELRRVIRQTLRRAARTWAPLPLPVNRVVVGVGFPSAGKIDVYDEFPANATPKAERRALVVVSLGLRDGGRELEPSEVAGALASQIQAVIDERYRNSSVTQKPEALETSRVPSPIAGKPTPVRADHVLVRSARTPASSVDETARLVTSLGTDPLQHSAEIPGLRDVLATQQKDQSLVATGPSANGTHQ